ncbi:MAG: metallophosphoesterase family protein [Granulicella sp.]
MQIGVISDTHGLLRPEALAVLRDASVEHILHAGDIGNYDILITLRTIAPVTAIRGNVDIHGACAELPATEMVELGGVFFYLVHSVRDLDLNPAASGISVVVSGHSHQPGMETQKGVLYLNPGSAGPRRFQLPITLAMLTVKNGTPTARILQLL